MKKRFLSMFIVVLALSLLFPMVVSAQEGGDIRVGIGADPESLDPLYAQSSPSAMVMVHIMETLFEMTPDGDI